MGTKKSSACIRFEDISLLSNIIGMTLCIQSSDIGINDANSCCLIEQKEFSRTAFTSITPGRNIVTRFINHVGDHSGGTVGLKFLCLSKELMEKTARLKSTNIQAVNVKGVSKGLQLSGVKMEDGKEVIKHKLVSRLYMGNDADFGPLFRADKKIAEIESSVFDFLIDTMLAFGGYSTEKQFSSEIVTTAVNFRFSEDTISVTGNNTKKFNQAHLEISGKSTTLENYSANIEGFNLKALKSLSGSGAVIVTKTEEEIQGAHWITFESGNGVVTLRCVNSTIDKVIQANLFGIEPSGKVQIDSYRGCSIEDFISSVTIQQPTGVSGTLLLSEDIPHMQIQDSQDLGGNEFSLIDLDSTCLHGDWHVILANKDALLLACDAIKKTLSLSDVSNKDIQIIQKHISKKKGRKSHLITILPLANCTMSVRFFCPVNRPESKMDQIDTKD